MPNDLKKRIEALLFIISKGLSTEELCQKANCSKEEVFDAINELKKEYELSDKAFTILNFNDNFRMTVHRELINGVDELVPPDLSKSLQKTLSMIAYKQGISQGEVVRMRGNKAYDHIKALSDMGFINAAPEGKSYKLTLSEKFFEYFHISKGEQEEKMKNLVNKMDIKLNGVKDTIEN
ncbi:MAG: SMC-Scp complex subunit ScpB [Candidatus Nanoarchaeia archaeon]|nr:SMC-Scp complex subunit ScpB [Candidatus Nanoarchaeia archaeon]